jgi:hypothetical protein
MVTLTTGLPAAAGRDDDDSPDARLEEPDGDSDSANDATVTPPDDEGAAADVSEPSSDPQGSTSDDPAGPPSDEEEAAQATAGRRFRRWLRTVPGLAASTVVTTVCAAVTTAVLTGAVHLWPETSSVSVAVETDPLRLDVEESLVQLVPVKRFDGTRPDNGCAGFWNWARDRGGVDADRTRLQLTVTNSGSNTALITGMRAKMISRRPVSQVVETTCPTQGEAEVYSVGMDLDKPQPYGIYDRNGESRRLNFTVAAGELETFLVTADIKHGAAQWELVVDLVEDGDKRTIVVDDGGKPFTTVTRPTGAVGWVLDPHGGGWSKASGGSALGGQPDGAS